MNIFYFGADASWKRLLQTGFRRRNTCILKALADSAITDKVYVIRKVSRAQYFRHLLSYSAGNSKVKDVFFFQLFPDSWCQFRLFENLNRRLANALIRMASTALKNQDLIWCYWPKGFELAYQSGLKGTLIFDADHNIVDDPNIPEDKKPARVRQLLQIASKAKYILSSTLSMIKWFNQQGFNNAVRVRNGVSYSRFVPNFSKDYAHPLRIIYCGTLSRWIDYELFSTIVKANPDWEFTIIGKPYQTEDWKILTNFRNVIFLGEREADEVASILPAFDVAINFYKRHPALDVDSMKIYEYLAAGLPVVSTAFHDHLEKDFDNLLLIGNNYDEINKYLHEIKNKTIEINKKRYLAFIGAAGWNNRIDEFLEKLKTI